MNPAGTSAKITDVYHTLGWIINNSDEGMFLLCAPEHEQEKIAWYYQHSNVAIYDYKQNPGMYAFNHLEQWIEEQNDARVYFLLNLHMALLSSEDTDERIGLQRLNFSRDMIMRLHKNIVFCVTEYAMDLMIKRAPDLYSFIKLKMTIDAPAVPERFEPPAETYDLSTGVYDKDLEINFDSPRKVLFAKATGLNRRGLDLKDDFRYDDALVYLGKALEIHGKLTGGSHPNIAALYGNIGAVYLEKGDYPKAFEYYQKSLEVSRKVFGEDHPEVAGAYNNIGEVYRHQGDFAGALDCYQKALEIQKKVFGNEHPDIADSYNNIGIIYRHQGNYEQALDFYQNSLKIRKKVFGNEHFKVADSYNNIGDIYNNQRDYTEAFGYHQKALEIRQFFFNNENPVVADSYNNIGAVYAKQGDYTTALDYFQKAFNIYVNFSGKDHPSTRSARKNLENAKSLIPSYSRVLQ